MTRYLNPKTGDTIGYAETKGTVAEPFNVPMAWQASTLSYVSLSLDASGNLQTVGSGGGTSGNAAAGLTGASVPTSAGYTGFNSAGNLVCVSGANPMPVVDATVALTNPYRGTTSYYGGASGTVTIPSGARVVSMSAHATSAGTLTIFGGQAIPVPANNGFSDGWSGFVGPGSIVFTGTDSYYIAVNQ